MCENEDHSSKRRKKQTTNESQPKLGENGIVDWRTWRKQKKEQHEKWTEENQQRKAEKERKRAERLAKEEEEMRLAAEKGRTYTISIALPGSILENAQSPELKTYLVGQVARAAAIFNVDEIVIFDEYVSDEIQEKDGDLQPTGTHGETLLQMARLLEYLECPQYLRKYLFPKQKELAYVGVLNPLDCSHHLRANEVSRFREGVTLDKPVTDGQGSYVDVGLGKDVRIDKHLQPGLRVTVKFPSSNEAWTRRPKATVVSPDAPRTEAGLYWGYQLRIASSLTKVFDMCPYDGGYDLKIGTSENGTNAEKAKLPQFKHLLIVFGGLKGIEACVENDKNLESKKPEDLFDFYVNTCLDQGSRTIRTEEAILVSMSVLRRNLRRAQRNVGNETENGN